MQGLWRLGLDRWSRRHPDGRGMSLDALRSTRQTVREQLVLDIPVYRQRLHGGGVANLRVPDTDNVIFRDREEEVAVGIEFDLSQGTLL